MRKKIPQEVIDQILPLYKQGLVYVDIAEKLNISMATVGKVVRQSGYDRYHVGGALSKYINIPEDYTQHSKY